MTALVAFAWIPFSLLTIAKIFGLMEYSAIRASNAGAYGGGYGARGAGAGPGFADKPAAGAAAPGAAPAAGAGPGAAV